MGVQVGECKIRYKHFLAGQIHPKDVPLTLILSPLGLCHNCHPELVSGSLRLLSYWNH